MFKKIQRLKRQKDFTAVFQEGKAVYGKFFGIKAKPNQFNFSRWAVIVGKKHCRLAINRNRLKRQVKAALKTLSPQLPVGYDLVIIALASCKQAPQFSEISNELKDCLMKLRL